LKKIEKTGIHFEEIRAKLKSLIWEEKKWAILGIIEEIIDNSAYKMSDSQFFDLIGELFLERPENFMNKIYKKLYKRLKRLFNIEKIFEMEKTILKKFCFYDNEKLMNSFHGKLVVGKNRLKGRIYLTNYRFIGHGKFGIKKIYLLVMGMYAEIFWEGYILKGIQNTTQDSIQRVLGLNYQHNKPCFGFQIPTLNSYEIKKKKKAIEYKVDLRFLKKNKFKKKSLRIKVKILRGKNVPISEFKEKRKKILLIINDNLKNNFMKFNKYF